MQIVINISDSIYKDLQLGIGVGVVLKLEDIVVLPKGHGRLIDARAFSGEMFCEADLTDAHTCYDSIQRLLEKEQPIIEEDGVNENGNG